MTTRIKRGHGRRSQQDIADTLNGFLTETLPGQTAFKRERAAKLSALLLTIAGTGAASAAHAEIVYGGPAELSIVPEETSVPVGDIITADVSLSGLSNQLIGGYDLTIDFNPSVLTVVNVAFGSYLDGPDNSFQGTNTSVSSQLEVFEVSFGDLANQTGYGAIPFFSITFDTLAAGTSALTFDSVANAGTLLSDQNGNAFTNFRVLNGSVAVPPATTTAAPELDAASAGAPITVLVAAFLIVAQRRRSAIPEPG